MKNLLKSIKQRLTAVDLRDVLRPKHFRPHFRFQSLPPRQPLYQLLIPDGQCLEAAKIHLTVLGAAA